MTIDLAALQRRMVKGLDLTRDQATSLLQRIQPVILLGDLRRPEFYETQDIRHAAGGTEVLAAAGFRSEITIRNPSGSGVLVIVDHIRVSMLLAASSFRLLNTGVDLGIVLGGNKAFTDRRATGLPSAVISIQNNAAAPTGTVFSGGRAAADQQVEIFGPIILPPNRGNGLGVNVAGAVANHGIAAHFEWREIDLPPTSRLRGCHRGALPGKGVTWLQEACQAQYMHWAARLTRPYPLAPALDNKHIRATGGRRAPLADSQ